MRIEQDTVVSFHYRLTDADDQLIDHSEPDEPLVYLHGNGNIIEGLERALEGRAVGEKFSVTLEPDAAYGDYDESLVRTVDRTQFNQVDELEVGMEFQVDFPDGDRIATISEIEGEQVTIDGNHALAGETLNFEIEVTDVRPATPEELTHGHPHGPGGAH